MPVEPDSRALGSGLLHGMRALPGEPVRYRLELEACTIELNELLGEHLSIGFDGRIVCCHCGRATRKSYADGHCYQCFKTLASCDLCVVAPDRCHYAAGHAASRSGAKPSACSRTWSTSRTRRG
jgi:hypothetical protein